MVSFLYTWPSGKPRELCTLFFCQKLFFSFPFPLLFPLLKQREEEGQGYLNLLRLLIYKGFNGDVMFIATISYLRSFLLHCMA
jgi:hypothetical protein